MKDLWFHFRLITLGFVGAMLVCGSLISAPLREADDGVHAPDQILLSAAARHRLSEHAGMLPSGIGDGFHTISAGPTAFAGFSLKKLTARQNRHTEALRIPPAGSGPRTTVSIGTGWPIASGHVITNNHVVSGSRQIVLIDRAGNEIQAWPILLDEMNDIAFLEVSDCTQLPPALPLARVPAATGAEVFTIGFPKPESMKTSPRHSSGIISDILGLNDDPNTYQTTVSIQPGNSGGPLLNMQGEVVGVVSAMLAIQDMTQGSLTLLPNSSCARKIRCVTELYNHLPPVKNRIKTLPPGSGTLEVLSKRVRNSVLIVVAQSQQAQPRNGYHR